MPHLTKADQQAKVSATEARRQKEVALARLRQIEVGEREGRLLPAADVKRVWSEKLAALRDRALSLPDRLAARLVGRSEVEIRSVLRGELEEVLRGAHADAHESL